MSYDKYTWKTGEVITEEKLNHIEDGIANIEAGGSSFDLSDRMAKGSKTGAIIEGSVEGEYANIASGFFAHAEGSRTTASSNSSHAEGFITTAEGDYSHAEGGQTSSTGINAHAEGQSTIASGNNAHAEGQSSTASGMDAHAEGASTQASGNVSHAEGAGSIASGNSSHAEGYGTIANHLSQHVFGQYNIEDQSTATNNNRGNYVQIVGNGTSASSRSNARTLDWSGNETLSGKLTLGAAPTENMDAVTKQYVDNKWISGSANPSLRMISTVDEGNGYTMGGCAVAIGGGTKASGSSSFAIGNGTNASGSGSFAGGTGTTASGMNSHAEGQSTISSGTHSHAEGMSSEASGFSAHSEGIITISSGNASHAEGEGTIANHLAQHVLGAYNIEDASSANFTEQGTYIEIVGNGTGGQTPVRSNARTLDWSGNEWLAGKLTLGAIPTENMDAATKQYVDNVAGNILTDDIRHALLTCFSHVVWENENGQEYYNYLSNALNGIRTVKSINVTFDSSAVITTANVLDDLRAYLTVNATYMNDTIEIVNNYTLSGNLNVGTNEITVTYSGKVATFNVSVSNEIVYKLPSSTTFNGSSDYIDIDLNLVNTNKNSITIATDFLNANKSLSSSSRHAFIHNMHEVSPYPGFSIMNTTLGGNKPNTNLVFTINSDTTLASTRYEKVPGASDSRIKLVMTIDLENNLMKIYSLINGVSYNDSVVIPSDYIDTNISENLLIGCYQQSDGTKGRYWKGTIYDFTIYNGIWTETEATEYLQEDHS